MLVLATSKLLAYGSGKERYTCTAENATECRHGPGCKPWSNQ